MLDRHGALRREVQLAADVGGDDAVGALGGEGVDLARGQRFNRSTAMSMAAIARDPNAINSRLTLAVTLHFAARFREALPHLRILLKALETDPTVHRLAIQAGKWAGDDKLVEEALRLLKKYNPEQAEAAENFLKLNVPAPPRRN